MADAAQSEAGDRPRRPSRRHRPVAARLPRGGFWVL